MCLRCKRNMPRVVPDTYISHQNNNVGISKGERKRQRLGRTGRLRVVFVG